MSERGGNVVAFPESRDPELTYKRLLVLVNELVADPDDRYRMTHAIIQHGAASALKAIGDMTAALSQRGAP